MQEDSWSGLRNIRSNRHGLVANNFVNVLYRILTKLGTKMCPSATFQISRQLDNPFPVCGVLTVKGPLQGESILQTGPNQLDQNFWMFQVHFTNRTEYSKIFVGIRQQAIDRSSNLRGDL